MPYRYTSPLEEFPNIHQLPLPPPLQVIEQYKQWHSQDALEHDPYNNTNRTFIIAHYQCPISAGNWMHYFTSAFFWAILTNRTILWKYVSNESCHSIREDWMYPFTPQRCNVSTTIDDCHEILSRAPWIPSYEEWKHKVPQLDQEQAFFIPLEHSGPQLQPLNNNEPFRSMDVYYSRYPLIDIHPWAFLRLDHLIYRRDLRKQQLATKYAHATLDKLSQQWGAPFLFGLLWRSSFDYSTPIRQEILAHPAVRRRRRRQEEYEFAQNNNTSNNNNIATITTTTTRPFSLAIQSRHIMSKDDGCNITLEQECMRELVKDYQRRRQQQQTINDATTTTSSSSFQSPCQVTLLSDRRCTITSLTEWLQDELNCSAVVSQHAISATVNAVFAEHGPFSGSGFFQDMLLAGQTVNDGMVGSLEPTDGNRWRSSSELVEEAIAYHRTMLHWQQGGSFEQQQQQQQQLPDLIECTIRRLDVKTKPVMMMTGAMTEGQEFSDMLLPEKSTSAAKWMGATATTTKTRTKTTTTTNDNNNSNGLEMIPASIALLEQHSTERMPLTPTVIEWQNARASTLHDEDDDDEGTRK